MKVMQLNVWAGRLTNRIVELVKAEQPDVICMQEVFGAGDTEIRVPNNFFDVLERVAHAGNYETTFFAPKYSIDYGGHLVEYGNAMVLNQPLLSQETYFVQGSYTDKIDPAASNVSRDDGPYNLQIAQINIDSTKLTIANHHGFWQPEPIGTAKTVECMQRVADKLHDVDGPLILCGDLNVSADSPAMRVFDGFLEDLTATHNIKSTLSKLHYVENVACDHILVSPEVNVKGYRAVDVLASDHQALIIEFEV